MAGNRDTVNQSARIALFEVEYLINKQQPRFDAKVC